MSVVDDPVVGMTGQQGNHPADEQYMRAALRQADKAALIGEVPVGAVIVYQGRIIARGYNQREGRQDVTLHAEIMAVRQACRRLHSWRLSGCTLYVTLEPCLMCAGALIQARFDRIVLGAPDPKAGAAGSVIDAFALSVNHGVQVERGVLAEACSLVLKDFFLARRRQDHEAGSKAKRRDQAIEQQKRHL